MTLPDFLVIGAAKSGTTSLYNYLSQHPQVFMSPRNEVNFFALETMDLDAHFRGPVDRPTLDGHCVTTLPAYESLFAAAKPGQRVGECSPLYLVAAESVDRIALHTPAARLIAILRHPTDRAYSNFLHHRRAGIEPLADFAQALAAEPERLAQGWGPWPFWGYRQTGCYAEQLARYFTAFDRSQILVCLYDDLKRDSAALMHRVYSFLAVDPEFRPATAVRHNVGGQPRLPWLHGLMATPNPAKSVVNALTPSRARRRVRDRILGWNVATPPLDADLRRELDAGYCLEIARLQELTGLDLSGWLHRC